MVSEATHESYKSLISGGFQIVNFYSSAVQCRMFSKVLEELVCDYPFIDVVNVNINKYPKLAAENSIEAVPTVLFCKDGKELEKEVGLMSEEELEEKISRYYYG